MAAAGLGYALNASLSAEQLTAWGWRLPFVVGCLIVPFIFFIRRSLAETEDFKKRRHHSSAREVFRSMRQNWVLVVAGGLLASRPPPPSTSSPSTPRPSVAPCCN